MWTPSPRDLTLETLASRLVGSLASTWQLLGSPSEIVVLPARSSALLIDTVLQEFRSFFFSLSLNV